MATRRAGEGPKGLPLASLEGFDSLGYTTRPWAWHLACHSQRTQPVRGDWGSSVGLEFAGHIPSRQSLSLYWPHPRGQSSLQMWFRRRRGQTLAARAHSFYLLSLGYSTEGSFPKCPLGVEDSKVESRQLHGPSLPSPLFSTRGSTWLSSTAGTSCSRPGSAIRTGWGSSHLGSLESHGEELWVWVLFSQSAEEGSEGPARPPGAFGLRTPHCHSRQTLLMAHHPPENQVSENSYQERTLGKLGC